MEAKEYEIFMAKTKKKARTTMTETGMRGWW
jgi:hypothetical protein